MGTRTRSKLGKDGAPRHYIREWRKFRGLNQEQLAGRIEAAVSTVSQLENGKQGYSQPMLEALAVALDCDPADLLSVNPFKEGEVVDLMKLINDRNRDQAIRVLKALVGNS
jgi:transcriptional regulator with XRE-family HTH domain